MQRYTFIFFIDFLETNAINIDDDGRIMQRQFHAK